MTVIRQFIRLISLVKWSSINDTGVPEHDVHTDSIEWILKALMSEAPENQQPHRASGASNEAAPASEKASSAAEGSVTNENTGTKARHGAKRPALRRLNSELKQALDSWETLSEEVENKLSPEEEQLREVKRLLGELKDKLKQFSE